MKNLVLAAIAAFGLALSTTASANIIGLGGFDVEPDFGLTQVTFNNTDPSAVTSLTFDFTYIAQAPSWSEELTMRITHEPTQTSVLIGALAPTFSAGADYCVDLFGATCDYSFGGTGDSNPLNVSNLVIPFAVASGLGLWTIDIGEGFNDSVVPDGAFEDGSQIAINVAPVPVPGAVWLLASGLLGLARLRRRS